MTSFLKNVYDYIDPLRVNAQLIGEFTEKGQSNSVRVILERFAKDGISPVQPGRQGEFADSWTDEEPLDAKRVDDLLDTPDLSNMDGFEVREFVESNLETNPVAKPSEEVPPEQKPEDSPPPSEE